MKNTVYTALALITATACAQGCDAGDGEETSSGRMEEMYAQSQETRKTDLELISNSRVYFGHQSVGFNMLDGLTDLAGIDGVDNLRIVESREVATGGSPGFFHARVGENKLPKSKIDSFAADIRAMQDKPDIAFVKLCYVDFDPDTDVADLFSHYREALEALKQEHPEVTFAHTTVPLTLHFRRFGGVRGKILSLLGRNDVVDTTLMDSNIRRQEYNAMLFGAFPDDPIIDISSAESTRGDGTRETFLRNGTEFFSLAPSYTYDGGHLNEVGRRWVASEMIGVIANAIRGRE